MKYIEQRYSKGQIAIIVALSLVVLIGMVGLAIDSGRGYGVKAKLNAATDAASLAGARALSQGDTWDQQKASATAAAKKFFHANYPDGYLGSTPNTGVANHDPVVTVTANPVPPNCTPPYCGVTVQVGASADVPVTFMRVLTLQDIHVSASAVAGRPSVDLAFVMDITGSMSGVATSVKNRAKTFLDHLDVTRDRVTLITYNYGAMVNDPIQTTTRGFNKTLMQTHIGSLNFSGNTNFAEGFWQARNQLNLVPTTPVGNRSSLRIILFFTDGSPNTFSSTFPVRRMSTPNPICNGGSPTCNCNNSSTNAGKCTSPTTRDCSCTCTGSLVTGDGSSGTPSGLYQHETTNGSSVSGTCNRGNNIISTATTTAGIYQIPAWYNAPHGGVVPSQQLQIAPSPTAPPQLRTISATPSFTSINRAARNLAEEMAWQAREEGIYVFVLGLGDLLHSSAGPDNEMGERLLMCMANTNKEENGNATTPLSRCYDKNQTDGKNIPLGNQPVGTYCWARDDASLKVCYDKMASQILRLLN
jgi:Flp pilus assembly protein TadG